MQQLPSTCPPFAFHSLADHLKSSADQVPPIKLNGNAINFMKNQSISPEEHSLKKRL
jgi:hypothetical protein